MCRRSQPKNSYDLQPSISERPCGCKEKEVFIEILILSIECFFGGRRFDLCDRGVLGILRAPAPPPAAAQPTNSRRHRKQIVEQAGKALAAGQRPVERRHGASEPRIVVANPGAQNRAEHERQPLGAQHASE